MTEAKDPRADVVDRWKRTRFELEELGNAIDRLPDPAPAVVPDVEAAWEAMVADLTGSSTYSWLRSIVARHRLLIEAAIRAEYRDWMPEEDCVDPPVRAEGRGALDVADKLAQAVIDYRSGHTLEGLATEYRRIRLAQREPAESQA